MTLGLNTASNDGADFLPIAIYDARAGRLSKVERSQGPDGMWTSERIDITNPPPTFAVDMGSIEVGWSAFIVGKPDFHMVPLGEQLPAQPTKEHKQSFRVKIAGNVLGGVREFSGSAKCVLSAIDELHTLFERAPEAAKGQIPIVKMTGASPIVTKGPAGNTTNYKPDFEVVGWTDRDPSIFGERTVPAPTGRGAKPAATAERPSNHVPPPPPVAQPATAAAPAGMPF